MIMSLNYYNLFILFHTESGQRERLFALESPTLVHENAFKPDFRRYSENIR